MIHISAFADEIDPDPLVQVRVLLANGVRNIEFRAIKGTNVLDLSDRDHDEFREVLRNEGFGLSAIGSPIGKIAITEAFGPHLDRFERAIELARFYDCPRIRVFSFYIPAGSDPVGHRPEVLRRMVALAERAQAAGVLLLLENEKGIYGDTPERVLDVLEGAASPALGGAFDPANFLEVGADVAAAWDLLRERSVHIHVKDYDVNLHKNVPAGRGQGRIPEIIADAVAHGYSGYCTLEPHLVVAEKSFGFTGPERFGEAASALKSALDALGIAYD